MPTLWLIRTPLGVAVALPAGAGSLPIRHIIGIGRNYADHAKEQSADVPTRPMTFTKNPASACLNQDDIVIPPICRDPSLGGDQTDFEGELAVVLADRDSSAGLSTWSGPIKDVPESRALDCVLGYAIANDVSARWWQKEGAGGQFNRGKGFDTFCPLGPRVAPADEIPDPQSLRVVTRVNGQVMQDAPTSSMIFPVRRLISDLSRGTTLLPGTLILTGTPSGVGMARKPPVWLKAGDHVEIEIKPIGVLKNRVRNG
jgi:2-keto-4-pentenoate hydratase/2-oxohepta-3-ene-1,7-dioic acid hydratase in catechol pathway